jgi:drug/metabolite transporter (DMT)-like permease
MNSYEREIERQNQHQTAQIMKHLRGPLLLTGASCLFGSIQVMQHSNLSFVPPWTQLWIRYLIACLTLGIIRWLTQPTYGSETRNRFGLHIWKSNSLFPAFATALTGYVVSAGGGIVATRISSQDMDSLLPSLVPVWMFLLGGILLRERLELRKWIALFLSVAGAVIFLFNDGKNLPNFGPTSYVGDLWLMLSGLMWAYQAVIIKRHVQTESLLELTWHALLIAWGLVTPLMISELWQSGKILSIWQILFGDMSNLMTLLYLGIFATAAAFYMWNRGVLLTELSIGSVLAYFQVIAAAVLNWLLNGELWSTSFLVGGTILIVGMYWMLREPKENSDM